MYPPRPPRPKKTNIVRTRTGCHTCRARHRKCDEGKPACQRCIRQGLECAGYGTKFSFLDTTASITQRVEDTEAKKWAAIREREQASGSKANKSCDNGPPKKEEKSIPTGTSTDCSGNAVSLPIASPTVFQTSPSSSSSSSSEYQSWPSPAGNPQVPVQGSVISTHPSISSSHVLSLDPILPDSVRDGPPVIHRGRRSSTNVRTGKRDDTRIIPAFNASSLPPCLNFYSDREQRYQQIYLTHFNDYMSTTLSPVLRERTIAIAAEPGFQNIVLALSASSLTHLQGTRKQIDDGSVRRTFATDENHFTFAIKYYNSAIRTMAETARKQDASIESVLLATLLGVLFEWESGSPKGFFAHLAGADAIVLAHYDKLSRSANGRKLLSGWAELRVRKNMHRMSFRPLEEEKGQYEPAVADAHLLARGFCDQEGEVLTLLSNAYAVHRRFVLEMCMGNEEDPLLAVNRAAAWYTEHFGFSFVSDDEIKSRKKVLTREDLLGILAQKRTELDSWHNSLRPLDLPTDKSPSATTSPSSHSTSDRPCTDDVLKIQPMIFHSYGAAVRYLYYVVAQMLASEELLVSFLFDIDRSEGLVEELPIDSWAHKTLRILAGLDMDKACSSESLNIGVLWIIEVLMLCCPNVRVSRYLLDNVIPRLEKSSHGSSLFDIAQMKRLIARQQEEILIGRIPLLHHVRQGSDREMLSFVDSNEQLLVALHGRIRGGGTFNDVVEI